MGNKNPNKEIIKMEPDLVSNKIDGNDCCSTKDKTFKSHQECVFGDTDICEYQTTREFVNLDGIKQEFELPKIEGSDVLENIEYESVRDNVNNFPNTIKKEPENANEIKAVDTGDIKPVIGEISEYVQFKFEDESELLTSYCDLPTLKSEVEDNPNYFAEPCSSKQTLIKSKLSKHAPRNVFKQKKRRYRWSDLLKIFRSPRKNLFNAQFGKCYDTCYYCGQSFLSKSQFLYHFIVDHYAKKVTKVCKQKFGQYNNCRCINCLRTIFKNTSTPNIIFHSTLNCHLKIHTLVKPFKCEICSKQFSLKSNFKKHLKVHTGEKPFICDICPNQFSRKNHLEAHLLIHLKEKSFKCEICSKQFGRRDQLKTHLQIHTGKRSSFMCEICSKKFNYKTSFNNHLKIHTEVKEEEQFQCKICLKQFARKAQLKAHLKIHGAKPFKCEICSKQFILKSNLTKHLQIHTGIKPFICEICSKQFSRKNRLADHLLFHLEEKPFKCEICSKQFRRKDKLKSHLQIHTGERSSFVCEICSKKFNYKNSLNKHLKIHTGEKQFQCEICLKQFARKAQFEAHLIIHTGEKPFKCEICSQKFIYKSSLSRHLKIHTKKNRSLK